MSYRRFRPVTPLPALALALCLAGVLTAGAGHAQELLEPEKAFAFSAAAPDAERLEITWRIADGYYMYHDKFRVVLTDGAAALGPPQIPPGKKKKDEFFGEVEIHEGTVTLNVPLDRSVQPAATPITIEAHGQGCNEPVGVCYPPLVQTATIRLAAVTEAAAPAVSSLQALKNLLSGGEPQQEFLDPDRAFRFDLAARDDRTLYARFVIEEGYYLYQDKVRFESLDTAVRVQEVALPPGTEKEDEYFGKIVAYYNGFEVLVPLARNDGQAARRSQFKVAYQGCAEKGICYPPIEKTVTVDLPAVGVAAAIVAPAGPAPSGGSGSGGLWAYILSAFATGVLLTFTPCVLPMVPILSSIIVGQGAHITKAKGGLLAAAYVLGTSVTWAAAGGLAGATGDQLQAYFQNIWAIGAISLILVLLALSMFGLYQIQVPGFLASRLQNRTQAIRGGQLGMVFVLGLLSALIVGACVSPLLIVVLGAAIIQGDPLLGGVMMFAMAWGMGLFLIGLGLGAGFLLPKAGPWMERVNHAFGVLLIGVAIYLLGAVPEVPVLYLWSALFVVTAVYVGALQSLPQDASGWRQLSKGVGVFLLVWGVLALIGGMSGRRDILQPVDLAAPGRIAENGGEAPRSHARFTRVKSLAQLDEQLASARAAGKPMILDYYADWCVDCLRMDKATFQDTRVAGILNRDFVLVQVDVTDPNDADRRAIKQRFGVLGPPAMLFFDSRGNERQDLRRYGFMAPDDFLRHIASISVNHA